MSVPHLVPRSQQVRILALADSPVAGPAGPNLTGFGRVAKNILARFNSELGVTQLDHYAINFDGWGYEQVPWRLFPAGGRDWHHPKRLQNFINLIATGDYTHVWCLMDLDAFAGSDFCAQLAAVCRAKKVRPLIYFPVDAALEPAWAQTVTQFDVAVTYTEYGRAEVRKALAKSLYPIHVLPHGVEDYFRPLPETERPRLRDIQVDQMVNGKTVTRQFVQPDDFLMVNVNKNEHRKDLFRSLEILKGVRERGVPAKLILRTALGSLMGGFNIEQAARQIGLTHGHEYFVLGPVTDQNLVDLYNAADLYLTTTKGEGWGLGITEALACGCPVAMPNHTSCAEIARELVRLRHPGLECDDPERLGELLVLDTAQTCFMDSRVRPQVQLEGAVDRLVCRYKNPPPRPVLNPAQREWLSWPRIAAEMFRLLTK